MPMAVPNLQYLTSTLSSSHLPQYFDNQAGRILATKHNAMSDEKKLRVKKGSLAVQVGIDGEDLHRFVIPISYLYHSSFKELLEKAREMYGYHAAGPLRLPCSVDDFLQMRWVIEREGGSSEDPHHHHPHSFHHTLSFTSC